VPDGPTFGCPN